MSDYNFRRWDLALGVLTFFVVLLAVVHITSCVRPAPGYIEQSECEPLDRDGTGQDIDVRIDHRPLHIEGTIRNHAHYDIIVQFGCGDWSESVNICPMSRVVLEIGPVDMALGTDCEVTTRLIPSTQHGY
jgi:hypothetical protein